MIAITFALFSAVCTFLAAMSVIFLGVSVTYIVNMYFIYLTLTAIAVVAVPGARFLFSFFQECTESLRRTDETAARRRSLLATLSPLP
jgi:cobalamin biosynthesis protein CobD/CbiB